MRSGDPAGGARRDAGLRPGAVTGLLEAWVHRHPGASNQLLRLIYGELRRQADWFLRGERQGHTLDATGLVHEVYLRLVRQRARYQNRGQFFALAARMMRRVLVDHARARAAAKRPRRADQVELDEDELPHVAPRDIELLRLDAALTRLAALDPVKARLVELRHFCGLTTGEAASVLGVSAATVNREWNLARAWLYRYLTG